MEKEIYNQRIVDTKINVEALEQVKTNLKKFYFVGLVENQEDKLFMFNELGIKKFYERSNVSEKFFVPKDYEKTKELILSKCQFDKELYEYASKLNKEFKENNAEFDKIVTDIGIKRDEYINRVSWRFGRFIRGFRQLVYMMSSRLKDKSKFYEKIIESIKGEMGPSERKTISGEPLYVFIHIYKCAGTTINYHIHRNYNRKEFLLLYLDAPPFIQARPEIEEHLISLSDDQKDKLKVIFGHGAYYGIHRFFPNREVRYVTFLRETVSKTISHYNHGRTILKKKVASLRGIKNIERRHIIDGRILDFEEWFEYNKTLIHNHTSKFLLIQTCDNRKEYIAIDDTRPRLGCKDIGKSEMRK